MELKAKVADLENSVRHFAIRDIETENLRKELGATQLELAHLIAENKELKQKYSEMLAEKENPASKRKCKVIIPKTGKLGSNFSV